MGNNKWECIVYSVDKYYASVAASFSMRRQTRRSLTPEAAFGNVLREIRNKKGLSQEQLGFEAGYHRTYIGMLERGLMNPSLRTILSIASALDCPASEFVRRVEAAVGKGWKRERESAE
jgi:DNA-binding XRE family transcriptional regulator